MLLYDTIRVLFGFGEDWPGQGRYGFVLAHEEYQQSAWAGLSPDPKASPLQTRQPAESNPRGSGAGGEAAPEAPSL